MTKNMIKYHEGQDVEVCIFPRRKSRWIVAKILRQVTWTAPIFYEVEEQDGRTIRSIEERHIRQTPTND